MAVSTPKIGEILARLLKIGDNGPLGREGAGAIRKCLHIEPIALRNSHPQQTHALHCARICAADF